MKESLREHAGRAVPVLLAALKPRLNARVMDAVVEPSARFDRQEPVTHDGIKALASSTDQLDAHDVFDVSKPQPPLTDPNLNSRMPRQRMKIEQHAGRLERLVDPAKDVDHALGRQSSQRVREDRDVKG